LGIDAHHAETDPGAAVLAVTELSCSLVGEDRAVLPVPGTRLAAIFGETAFLGSHWCRFGANPELLGRMGQHGLRTNAWNADGVAEGVELEGHPFFVATLFQPQMHAEASTRLSPLIRAWVDAANARSGDRDA
jgi:CTP synthase (UTP-ammonia lyase)